MSVLIAHPTRQHSHRLAEALQTAGLLHSYWTLLPDRRALSWLPSGFEGFLPSAVSRHSLQFLPQEKSHVLPGPLLCQKMASRSDSVGVRLMGEWLAWAAFDRWVAARLGRLRPTVVVGYEMCCAETFKVARRFGIRCVLDAAAFHYALQEEMLTEDRCGVHTWAGIRLRRRKQMEIEHADQIICVSELARRSYVNFGVDAAHISVNPMGCALQQFAAPIHSLRSDGVKFIFVGMPIHRKGFDLLIASYRRLAAEYPDAELHVVGDAAMARSLTANNKLVFHGKLSHAQLGHLLARMDCLVLPSRLESFGMVVVEALAAGLPVIVSDHAGAAQAIRNGENGWVVPAGNEQALLHRMLDCCSNIEAVRGMSGACVASAADYDWSHYSRRSVVFFSQIVKY
jgi:glycosyltransferase involved in cell wall biosynthesis